MFGPGFLGTPKAIRTGLTVLGIMALAGLAAIIGGLACVFYWLVSHLQWVS